MDAGIIVKTEFGQDSESPLRSRHHGETGRSISANATPTRVFNCALGPERVVPKSRGRESLDGRVPKPVETNLMHELARFAYQTRQPRRHRSHEAERRADVGIAQ